jgi:spore maturation protein CgeB
VFIKPAIIKRLRAQSEKLVHFTPDPAFAYHRSRLFFEALPLYDYCITTKSFELAEYRKAGIKTIFCTQGYDPLIHRPYHNFKEKNGIVFIGHREEDREELISALLERKFTVTLAGVGWSKLARKSRGSSLKYLGPGIFAEEYARTISGAKLSLGCLSKIIPELHTTRTFEIPACGTALLTEKNEETGLMFTADEVVFFQASKDLIERVESLYRNPENLYQITQNGYKKVTEGGYDYYSIMKKIVDQVYPGKL